MNKTMVGILALSVHMLAYGEICAQSVSDSLPTKTLNEIIVDSQPVNLDAGISTHIPSQSQRKAARNAIDLLRQMGIPNLDVTPQSQEVRTSTGNIVALFIDRQPATPHDLASLPPKDVASIELLTYPTDPRFGGAQYVLNFVMRAYEYGGYTRIDASGNLADSKTYSAEGGVTSKMTYKKMTYDIFVTGGGNGNGHFGENSTECYKFSNGDESIRNLLLNRSIEKGLNLQTAFRALYTGNTSSMSNQIGFVRDVTPESDLRGEVLTSNLPPSQFRRNKSSHASIPFWIGNYYFMLPRGFQMRLLADLFYSRMGYNDTYRIMDQFHTESNVRERFWQGDVSLSISRPIHDRQAISATMAYNLVSSKDSYTGSNPYVSRLDIHVGNLDVRYAIQSGKVYGAVDAGVTAVATRTNGEREMTWKPVGSLNIQYAPTRKSQLTFSANYSMQVPLGSQKSAALVRHNEIMWLSGNPSLRPYSSVNLSAVYVWIPISNLRLKINSRYESAFNRTVPVYLPEAPDGGMLKTFENKGNYDTFSFGAGATLNLFGNSLQLSASPQLMCFKSTGIYHRATTSLYLDANVVYYLKDYYFMAYYMPAWHNVDMEGRENRYKDYVSVTLGWSHGNWNVALNANNLLRGNWINRESSFESKWYTRTERAFSANRHRSFSVEASYTFSYGKKIKHSNELRSVSVPASTIIK